MNLINKEINKPVSVLIVTLIYGIAILAGYLSLQYFQLFHPIFSLALADVIATVVVFIFSYMFKNSSIYDPYWSVIPVFIVWWWIIQSPETANEARQLIVLALVLFWGIRLTFNFIRGWKGLRVQDWRYSMLQEKHGKYYWLVSFFGIHFFPTVLVFLGCLPLYYVLQNPTPFQISDVLAVIVTLGAILVETIADEQLFHFKKEGNKGLMDRGLWRYSRHPNYFGEITFWIGIFIFCFATNIEESWWTSLGFVSMLLLFTLVSVPMMEQRHLEKRPEYKNYMKKVSPIFPWFKMKDI